MKNRLLTAIFVIFICLFSLTGCSLKKKIVSTKETTSRQDKYSITFICNGGSPLASMRLKEGETIMFGVTVKDGYDFLGWYMDEAFTVQFKLTEMPDRDLTLYAKWEETRYSISFVTYSKENFDPQFFKEGEEITTPLPKMDGYKFDGWYLDEELTHPFYYTKMPNKNLTLYAKWVFQVRTITFVTNFDDVYIEPLVRTAGEAISLRSPEKATYKFLGWYSDSALTKEFVSDVMPDSNITLYAKWERMKYDVTLHDGDEIISTDSITYDGRYILNNITKEHCVFEGWFYDSEFKKEATEKLITIKGKTDLYAKWRLIDYFLSIETNYADCAFEKISHTYIESVTLPTLESKYYKLMGYYYDKEFIDPIEEDFKAPNSDLTLFAKLEPIMHKVSYMEIEREDEFYMYGDKITLLDAPGDKLKRFIGWYIGDVGPYTEYVMGEEDVAFTPHYKEIAHTITFHTGLDGYTDSKLTIIYDIDTVITAEMLKDKELYPLHAELFEMIDGYIGLIDWRLDESLSDESIFYQTENKNIDLYANFGDVMKHSYELIYFDMDKEKFSYEDESIENCIIEGHIGEKIDYGFHYNPSCEYMNFVGYFEVEIIDGELVYGDELSDVMEKDITLIAEKWNPFEFTLTVEYTFDNEKYSLDYTLDYRSAFLIQFVKCDEYEMTEIYYDEDLTDLVKDTDTMPHRNITVYGKIVDLRKSITLKNIGNDENSFEIVKWVKGKEYALKGLESDDEKTFLGWKYEIDLYGTLYEEGDRILILDDVTLVAIYELKETSNSLNMANPTDANNNKE